MSKELEKEMYELLDQKHKFKRYSGPTRYAIVALMIKAHEKGREAELKNRAM